MRKFTRRYKRTSRKTRNNNKKHTKKYNQQKRRKTRGGCGAGTCMVGGEDPKLSADIFNYNISDLPHKVA
jgi:hypothetical protein